MGNLRSETAQWNSFSPECIVSDTMLVASLLDGLTRLDEQAGPFGLYACEEYQMHGKPYLRHHQEGHLGIKPVLKALGCTDERAEIKTGIFTFDLPDKSSARLQIARTSKVKVRKFGSRYRGDAQEKYPERWKALGVDEMLWNLWKPSIGWGRTDLRVLVLIGFDGKPQPLEQELNSLNESVSWGKRETAYETRVWRDRYERDFSVRLSAWSHRFTVNEET